MDDKVGDDLHQAYTGEAKAVLRLQLYAEKAEQEGYPQIAKLFRVVSLSERIHGVRSLRLMREIRSTEENLKQAFQSEVEVAEVAYDNFIKHATEAGEEAAAKVFTQSRDVEDFHAKLYKEAMQHMMEERETQYYVCKVCGYPSDEVLPDECPVCGANKDQFLKFE